MGGHILIQNHGVNSCSADSPKSLDGPFYEKSPNSLISLIFANCQTIETTPPSVPSSDNGANDFIILNCKN